MFYFSVPIQGSSFHLNLHSMAFFRVSDLWHAVPLFLFQASPKVCCSCYKFVFPFSCRSSYTVFCEYSGWNEFWFVLTLCKLVLLQIFLSVNENLTLCKTIIQKGNPQEKCHLFSLFCILWPHLVAVFCLLYWKNAAWKEFGFQ